MTPLDHPGRRVALDWPGGRVEVQSLGAMIADLAFYHGGGTVHRPLARAPWVDTPDHGQTGLMAGLSGEWPCVPFGTPGEAVGPAWQAAGWEDSLPHGMPAHLGWDLSVTDQINAVCDLPEAHPIARVERWLHPEGTALHLGLRLHPRRACRLPIGLHGVFALPDEPGQMIFEIPGATEVWSHPVADGLLAPGTRSPSLDQVALAEGGTFDLTRLPLAGRHELRLQVVAPSGQVILRDQANDQTTVFTYDPVQFPCVMLWVSNRGRDAAPWSGRHLALGIEPVCACFDLGTALSAGPNPLAARGIATAIALEPGQPFTTEYGLASAER